MQYVQFIFRLKTISIKFFFQKTSFSPIVHRAGQSANSPVTNPNFCDAIFIGMWVLACLLPPLRQLTDKEQNPINIVTFYPAEPASSEMEYLVRHFKYINRLFWQKLHEVQKYDLFNRITNLSTSKRSMRNRILSVFN